VSTFDFSAEMTRFVVVLLAIAGLASAAYWATMEMYLDQDTPNQCSGFEVQTSVLPAETTAACHFHSGNNGAGYEFAKLSCSEDGSTIQGFMYCAQGCADQNCAITIAPTASGSCVFMNLSAIDEPFSVNVRLNCTNKSAIADYSGMWKAIYAPNTTCNDSSAMPSSFELYSTCRPAINGTGSTRLSCMNSTTIVMDNCNDTMCTDCDDANELVSVGCVEEDASGLDFSSNAMCGSLHSFFTSDNTTAAPTTGPSTKPPSTTEMPTTRNGASATDSYILVISSVFVFIALFL
jgi:hypothetical protein